MFIGIRTLIGMERSLEGGCLLNRGAYHKNKFENGGAF